MMSMAALSTTCAQRKGSTRSVRSSPTCASKTSTADLSPGLPLFLQPKLAVSQPGDPSEIEADRVADQVMRMSVPTVQRQCAACEEEEAVTVPRKAQGAIGSDAPASVGSVIGSSGQPLAASTRAFFEPRFGQDLGHVRVHTNGEAQQSAHDVNALAYTVGFHVVFGDGRYAPGTPDGQRLLAHELTHVVQQTNEELGVQRQAQEPGVCDPANLGTLGPAFRKSEADVQRMGLVEKHVIQRPTPEDDFVLYCPHKSTRPLKKLVPCTKVYWIGDAETSGKGRGKDEVWAQQEGETSLYWGYVKKTKIQDQPCVREGVTTVQHIRPVPTSSRSNCRVAVRAVDPPVPIASHLFIVASKENGVEYGYRGGPDIPGGLFALIETDVGRYEEGLFPDWDPAAKSVTVLSGAAACGMAECFLQKCREIDEAEIGYEHYGPNSNSVVSELLSGCGAPRKKPDVWAPGWDVSLFASPAPRGDGGQQGANSVGSEDMGGGGFHP